MTFADSQHDKCQRFSIFNLSEFPEKPDQCLPPATAFPSQQSLKRHLKTYYYPPLLRLVLSKLQIRPFATFHNALQQGTACFFFFQGGLTPNNVTSCKCDILHANYRIYIQMWQVSLLCRYAIHYASLADFDLFDRETEIPALCGCLSEHVPLNFFSHIYSVFKMTHQICAKYQ